MGELVDRHAEELGGSPRDTALWLSSVWGPFDEAWLMSQAASLPEPARGRWVALLASPRFDRNISRRKAIAYASRMAAERLEHDAVEVAGPPLGKVAEEASARTAFQVAKSAGLGFSFSMPNEGQIERVLNSAGISKSIKGFSQASVKLVEDEVVRGMMAGSSFEDIARTIRKETPVESMVRARRIARTMSTDCAAEAKMREYEELGVERYTIVCTLDERTCATCGAMDGRSFPVKGAHPRPSFHPNCRCIVREELSEEWTDRMTRSARDEDGKTVQVPASMTYDEWKARFARPAKTQGGPSKARGAQKASQPAQGRKAQQRLSAPDHKVQGDRNLGSLETPKPSESVRAEGARADRAEDPGDKGRKAQSEKIDVDQLGNLKGKLPAKDYAEVKKALRDSDDLVKRVWKSVGAGLKIAKTRLDEDEKASFVPGVGVLVDINKDSKGMSGSWIEPGTGKMRFFGIPPYRTFWHEMGHCMAYAIAERNGMAGPMRDVSTGYVSKVHGCTLDEMIVRESNALVEKRRKELGSMLRRASYDTAYDDISSMLDVMDPEAAVGISDILNGATKGKVRGPFIHKDAYWNGSEGETPCPAGVEAFAEITSAMMTNPKALKEIKKYFGRSLEIYEEILREAGDGDLRRREACVPGVPQGGRARRPRSYRGQLQRARARIEDPRGEVPGVRGLHA